VRVDEIESGELLPFISGAAPGRRGDGSAIGDSADCRLFYLHEFEPAEYFKTAHAVSLCYSRARTLGRWWFRDGRPQP
jgi:hypothetical protein